jgi:type VI secretion system protein ImpC
VEYSVSFGRLGSKTRAAPGPAFRIALLGDFSGRANAGVLETGTALAGRKPHKADVDTLDTLLARLSPSVAVALDNATTLSAPVRSMDDFHPDQLVENLPVFAELLDLRRSLQSKSGFDRAAREVLSWSGAAPLPPPPRQARGTAIATDRKLSDFARLTGRTANVETPAEALIRRIVGPFVVPGRDARQDALVARVDAALSDTMRRVLHHPDFQTAEALWRGVEFLVRRIETGAQLQIVLYDISAEELAADLAAADQLDRSALYSLLVEQPALDAQQGPLSVIAGLYQFEATPPHADLLGRIAQLAAASGAPFIAGIGPDALKAPRHEWHPLIRQSWEALRALPAAAYLGLAAPRFLLRMPYGKRTDPIDAFAFEEFTRQSGLAGMLWGNPALLAAGLLAETWQRDGRAMQPGSIATVGDLPVYVYHDTDGEQIALPCTERLFTERDAVRVGGCGVIPVLSLRGRPEVRLGGFASVAGGPLAGRWAPVEVTPPPQPAAAEAPAVEEPAAEAPTAEEPAAEAAPADDLDALLASLNTAPPAPAAEEPAAEAAPADDLDALLASLNAAPPAPAADDTEADLDALLAALK